MAEDQKSTPIISLISVLETRTVMGIRLGYHINQN